MRNYYTEIGASPENSTEEIKQCIERKKKELLKGLSKKDRIEKEKYFNSIQSILTDYHKRRDYDNYLLFYSPLYLPQMNTYQDNLTTREPIENSYFYTSSKSSIVENGKDGYILYEKNYTNKNGKEESDENKYFIDKYGSKTLL